jgi:hypothetical protein
MPFSETAVPRLRNDLQRRLRASAFVATPRCEASAIRSYEQLITLHPSAPETDWARSQIRNIVNLVVPAGEVLTAQVELALRHLEPGGDGEPPS